MSPSRSDKPCVKPLELLVDGYLSIHRRTSLRALVFGLDPDHAPAFIRNESRWLNRDCLVDLYAIGWPIVDIGILIFISTMGPTLSPFIAIPLGVVGIYRLNELFGSIFYILICRARSDTADGRKLAISLIAYVEPILLFAILHSVVACVLPSQNPTDPAGYLHPERSWGLFTALHFSVGCYTTVGWGDVSATHPASMFLSDVEAVMGILMFTLTVSRFVSAVLDQPDTANPDSQTESTHKTA